MRHRRRGRIFGRNPSHQRALLRSLASNLFLTQRDTEDLRFLKLESEPDVEGRIITTVAKAKEVRPLVEKCITIAKKGLVAEDEARQFGTQAGRGSEEWRSWRGSDRWKKWNAAIAPAIAARRRCLVLLGDKLAVAALFQSVAPRFRDRQGGYTRIVRLAHPRLGDAGPRAILELTGVNDRAVKRSTRPAFDNEPATETAAV
jgi:large subunit ribosomal protein L17